MEARETTDHLDRDHHCEAAPTPRSSVIETCTWKNQAEEMPSSNPACAPVSAVMMKLNNWMPQRKLQRLKKLPNMLERLLRRLSRMMLNRWIEFNALDKPSLASAIARSGSYHEKESAHVTELIWAKNLSAFRSNNIGAQTEEENQSGSGSSSAWSARGRWQHQSQIQRSSGRRQQNAQESICNCDKKTVESWKVSD